jgi:hypothetical protein
MRHYVAGRCGVQSQKCHEDSHWVRTACVPFKVLLLLFARGQSCIWPVRRGLRSVTPCALVVGYCLELEHQAPLGAPLLPQKPPAPGGGRGREAAPGAGAPGVQWQNPEGRRATPAPRAVRGWHVGWPQTKKRVWGDWGGGCGLTQGGREEEEAPFGCPGLAFSDNPSRAFWSPFCRVAIHA